MMANRTVLLPLAVASLLWSTGYLDKHLLMRAAVNPPVLAMIANDERRSDGQAAQLHQTIILTGNPPAASEQVIRLTGDTPILSQQTIALHEDETQDEATLRRSAVPRELSEEEAYAIRFKGAHYPVEIRKLPRRSGDGTSAVVGIVSTMGADEYSGTGFLVDACHVLTAAHVVLGHAGRIASAIQVGIGPSSRAAGESSAPDDLAGNFGAVQAAVVEWVGSGLDLQKSLTAGVVESRHAQDAAEGHWAVRLSEETSGDWAILRLSTCLPASTPVYRLQESTGVTIHQTSMPLNARGYPDWQFSQVTETTCFPDILNSVGGELDCRIYPGNSGGPVVFANKPESVIGIVSFVSPSANKAAVTTTFMPAGVLALGLNSQPPDPDCAAELHRLLSSVPIPNGKSAWTGSPDELSELIYRQLVVGLARQTHDFAATYMPARPDQFWCRTLTAAYGNKNKLPTEVASWAGDWHVEQWSTGLRIRQDGPVLVAELTGDDIEPLANLGRYYGPRALLFGHQAQQNGSVVRWTVDFRDDGPILVATRENERSILWMRRLLKGPPASPCGERRRIAAVLAARGDGADAVAQYNRMVQTGECHTAPIS